MLSLPLLAAALAVGGSPAAANPVAIGLTDRAINASLAACQQIASQISSASLVSFPPLPGYLLGAANYAQTNTLLPTCLFYPATVGDIGIGLKAVGANKAPFAVRGGGHCMNNGCSSTNGVMFAMNRWDRTILDTNAKTVTIGAGLIWDDVYSNLTNTGYSVVGGRVGGVGVAGFALGGGYSYYTNQYGLTSDTIVQYELVLPNGNAINVTDRQETADLFFGLKGGYNNFGIVSRFWLKAIPSTPKIWGGAQVYTPDQYDAGKLFRRSDPRRRSDDLELVFAVSAACSAFDLGNKDPKASLLCTSLQVAGLPSWLLIAFYDAPSPPDPSPFANFSKIPTVAPLWRSQTQADFTKSIPSELAAGQRVWYHSASVRQLSPAVMKAVKTISQKYAVAFTANTGVILNLNPEPFVPGFFKNSVSSAYPHTADNELKPIEINLAWVSPTADAYMQSLAFKIEAELLAAARADGQDLPAATNYLYPNYALQGTPLAHMFSSANLPRLKAIAQQYDPQRVMTQAGGWKFQ